MQKELTNHGRARRILAGALCLVLALAVLLAVLPQRAFADTAEPKTLIVTVVEEIPADEIEDDDVPLASLADTGKSISDSTRHVLLMSALLLCVAVYVFYFRTYEKRLRALRWKAAEAENRWHAQRQGEWSARP